MPRVAVGTAAGLLVLEPDGGAAETWLDGQAVRAVAPAAWQWLWAIVGGQEIWRGAGGGWSRVASLTGLRGECLADTRANAEDGVLIGTAEAHLVRVTRGGLEKVESFDRAPEREHWYTPWGGPPAVRSITENRDWVFVNVHFGGVLRSRDGGANWEPTIDLHADVHRIVTGNGRVYAAGAHGLSVSANDGVEWRLSARGLHATYCRSVAVCGDAVLLTASDGPGGGRAAIYRSGPQGQGFERCRAGLPQWFEGNLDSLCLDALPDGSLSAFGSESGEVFTSPDQGLNWTRLAEGLPTIHCVVVLP